MEETDIEVLRQVVSRTDKTGNQKVEILKEFIEQQLKNCNSQSVNGSILAKAEMINALTNTIKVNQEVLGYSTIRDKTVDKLRTLLDSILMRQ